MDLKDSIRTIVDFPVEGVRFRDISTLVAAPEAFRYAVDQFYVRYENMELDVIAAIDARGFICASALSYLMGLPLIPLRKPGKLPFAKVSTSYTTEYSTSGLEIHRDALQNFKKVLVVDDLIATGGSLVAARQLISELGGETVEFAVVVELNEFNGRQKLLPVSLFSLVNYDPDE